nr:MAG TPA: hypothetical protein [Caudoviricetes sp.]
MSAANQEQTTRLNWISVVYYDRAAGKRNLPPKENRGGRASTPRNWPPR